MLGPPAALRIGQPAPSRTHPSASPSFHPHIWSSGNLLKQPKPQFPNLQNGDNNGTHFAGLL